MIAILLGLFLSLMLCLMITLPRIAIARHNRKLAEARLEITRCVTELQAYLRNGDICSGECCHDWLSMIMQNAQFFTQYGTVTAMVRTPRADLTRMLDRLDLEIRRKPEAYQAIVDRFFMAYVKALRYSQPLTFWVFIVITLFRILVKHMQVTRKNIAESAARIAVVSSDPAPILA